ncbi:DEAD/DEAH box helicase family protein (plasmid) [Rhodococcus koreensis]|nr:helicase-related protein [Rhodococcus koreensis]QSE87019.1 DEAD/DEAH box helicase family protein [Rhodococcus koreensis]
MDGADRPIHPAGAGIDPAATRGRSADTDERDGSAGGRTGRADRRRDRPQPVTDSVLTLRAQWATARTARTEILHRGARVRQHLDAANTALDRARQQNNQAGIDTLTQRIADLSVKRQRLLGEFGEADATEGRLRNQLAAAGIDPATIDRDLAQRVDRAQRRPSPAWADDPATDKQIATLRRMLDTRGLATDLLDARITKGQADTAIKALLTGSTPDRSTAAPPREREDTAPDLAVVETLTATEYDTAALDRVRDALLTDSDLVAAASTPSNSFAQFKSWAADEVRDRATVTLADLVDPETGDSSPELARAAQALLADPSRLDTLRYEWLDEIWQDNADSRAELDVEPPSEKIGDAAETTDPAPESEVARQQRTQRELADDDAVTVTNWHERGRAAFDPADPLAPADPATDPVAAEVLASVRAHSKTARELREQFTAGYDTGRRTFTEPTRTAILSHEIGTDPDVIAIVRGRGPRQLAHADDFEDLVAHKIAALDDYGDLTRAAALAHMHDHNYFTDPEIAARPAVAGALAQAGPLPWTNPEHESTWRAFTLEHFRADPLARAALRYLINGERLRVLDEMVEDGLSAFAHTHPDLAAAVTTETRPRVEAAIRQEIAEAFADENEARGHGDKTGEPLYDNDGWAVAGRPGYRVAYRYSRTDTFWEVTTDGWGQTRTWGKDHRVAMAALFDAAGRDNPNPVSEQLYQQVRVARDQLAAHARDLLTDDEHVQIIAASDVFRHDPYGISNAVHCTPVRDAMATAIERLRQEHSEDVAILDSTGLPLEHVLLEDSIQPALRQLYAEVEGDGGLFTRDFPTDVVFIRRAGTAIVGDPDGTHVTLQDLHSTRGWSLRGIDHPERLPFGQALALAREHLRTHSGTPQVEPTPAAEVVADAADRVATADPAPEPAPALADARTTEHYRQILEAAAAESFSTDGDYLTALTDTTSDAFGQALSPAAAAQRRMTSRTISSDEITDALRATVDRLTALDAAVTEIRDGDPDTDQHHPLRTLHEKIAHGVRRSRQALDTRLAATTPAAPESGSVRSADSDIERDDTAAAPSIEERQDVSTDAEAATDDEILEVPQDERGEPLTSPHWRNGTLIPARRPDGSTVYLAPAAAARYRTADVPQSDPDPGTDTALDPQARDQSMTTGTPEPGGDPFTPVAGHATEATTEPGAAETDPTAAANFALGAEVLAPSAAKQRARANLDALAVVQTLTDENRPATPDEQRTLAQWSGWGGVPQIFDTAKPEFDSEREELRLLLSSQEYDAARLSTVNAHYTDPTLVAAMWRAVERAGLPDGARVLEPGCGSGHFLGLAPATARMVGVELDPITARIAHHLYPSQHVRNHGFEAQFAENGTFTATIGNVPFGNYPVYDDVHNPNSRTIHNHFVIKSLHLTAPGGYVAVITSAFTSDAARADARKEIAELGDLVGGVRLPSTAHRRQAATDVLTDILIFRRREEDRPTSADTEQWIDSVSAPMPTGHADERVEVRVNRYFQARPHQVLGRYEVGHGMYSSATLKVIAHDTEPLPLAVTRVLDRIIDTALDSGQHLTATAPDRTLPLVLDEPGLHTRLDAESAVPGTLRFDERTERWEQYQVGAGWVLTPNKSRTVNDQWQRLLAMGDSVLAIGDAARDLSSTPDDRQRLRDQLGRQYDDYVSKYGYINRFTWTSHATENSPEKTAANFTKLEAQWRIHAARNLAVDNGADPGELDDLDLDPYDGTMPDEVRQDLHEQARTPAQGPRKNRHHLQGAISFDPRIAMVRSLELFNDETQEATKTSIFTEDATLTARVAESAGTIDEAIAISFDELGRVDPDRMAVLLGTDATTVLEQARGKIYPSLSDPNSYVLAAEVLSGDVRSKLARARIAESENPDVYQGIVDALEEVVPPELDPGRIGVRPGADWVGTDLHKQFLAEEFGIPADKIRVSYAPVSASWKVETDLQANWENAESGYNDTWGIPGRYSGIDLFETIANNKPVEVNKTDDELDIQPKPRFHPKHTTDLRNRAVRLEEKFVQWLWSNPQRYEHLKAVYNERFNRFVTPHYDTARKQYPGLNTEKYWPYEYQRRAVERLLHGETILLDHCVGSGKTLTMTIASMEMRRLGQVRQPWVVAPNHLVDQWASEVRDAYPAAKILVGGDLDGFRDRQRFIGQTAVTDWDLVIVPESVFKLIGVTKETELDYIDTKLMELREALDSAKTAGNPHTVKEIEKAIQREKTKQNRLVRSKASDVGLTFEQSGCDFIWVDEAHYYKNLARASNSADLSKPEGSQRASDLEMKARLLRDRAYLRNIEAGRPDAPAKAIAFATGTPVSNSMSELWVMNRYLRPDLLEKAGVSHIDAWAQTFAKQRTTVEMNVTSTALRPVSRMAEYQNLPSLMSMVDQFRDVVTEDQIPVELPRMRTGKPIVVEFDLSPQVRDFMFDLDERMGMTSGKDMDVDNALKISNDGRNASLHPTLAGLPEPDPEHDRIVVAADLIWATHTEHQDLITPADRYGPEAHGVFQMVFCDRGTPKLGATGGDNLYSRLRDALVDRGMARDEIAFIHDYPSPKQKQQLFADCRAGKVRVLIGSTRKLGTGVNAQRLLKQLISLDPAWTAADMQQRFGRIIRQGNVHAEVDVVNIVARRSYDATMWQIIERKAHAVQQLRSSDVPDTMEDVGGDIALSAAQTKAAATGDPVYVQVVEQQAYVDSLESEQTMIANANAARHGVIGRLDRTVQRLDTEIPALDAHAEKAVAWLAIEDRDHRLLTVGGRTIADNDSENLVAALQHVLQSSYIDARAIKSDRPIAMFEIGGITVTGRYRPMSDVLQLAVTPGGHRLLDHKKVLEAASSATAARGLIQQVRNLVKEIPARADSAHRQLEQSITRRDDLAAQPDGEFTRGEELSRARYDLAELKADVNARENSPDALRARGHDLDRRRAEGLYPRWSLELNPTPAYAEREGTTPAMLAASVPVRMESFGRAWEAGAGEREERRAEDPWKPRSPDGSRFQFGANQDSGEPGAVIQWTDRSWHWTAWDGNGAKSSGLEDRCDSARYASETAMRRFEKEAEGPDTSPAVDRGVDARADGHPHSITDMLHRQSKNSIRNAPLPAEDTGKGRGTDRGI